MCQPPSQAKHTSAYDRIQAQKGVDMPSAALDLVAIKTEEAGQKIRETPVHELREERRRKRRNPTGRRVLRDGWLAPMKFDTRKLSSEPQVCKKPFRASDKGFLDLNVEQYISLLTWTAKQSHKGDGGKPPPAVVAMLMPLGIEPCMWRDLVWEYKRYFGRSTCAGSPESMQVDAQRHGKAYHSGQQMVKECFAS